jgi:hypothetical protein
VYFYSYFILKVYSRRRRGLWDQRAQATRRVTKGFGPALVKAIDKCVVIALWMSEYGTLKYDWCQIFGPHTFYIICAVLLTTLSLQILPDLRNRYVPKVQRKSQLSILTVQLKP